MNSDLKYCLTGYLKPPGLLLGFIMPVFQAQDEYFTQNIDSMGNVSGFSQVDERDIIKPSKGLPSWTTKIGNTALYAFSCGDDKVIWGPKDALRHSLRESISTVRAYPFALIDAAKFLNDDKLLSDALSLAFEDLLRFSAQVACKWANINIPIGIVSNDSSLKSEELEIRKSLVAKARQKIGNRAVREESLLATGSGGVIPRYHPRNQYEVPIQYALLNSQQFERSNTLSYSVEGLSFVSHHRLEPETEVCIVMDNYDPAKSGPEAYKSYLARIRWIHLMSKTGSERYAAGGYIVARSHEILATEAQIPRFSCDMCGNIQPVHRIHETGSGVCLCRQCLKHFSNIPSEKIRKCVERFLCGNVI